MEGFQIRFKIFDGIIDWETTRNKGFLELQARHSYPMRSTSKRKHLALIKQHGNINFQVLFGVIR